MKIFLITLLFSISAFSAPTYNGSFEASERQNMNLQNKVNELSNEIEQLKAKQEESNRILGIQEMTCYLRDTHRGELHRGIGYGKSKAAEAAKQACEANTFDSSCNGEIECTSQIAKNDIAGFQCVLTATGGRGEHIGTGNDIIAAERSAKNACNEATLDSYCTDAKIECRTLN